MEVKSQTKKIVACAMFTALSAVATMVIQIPLPMSGYANLGDAFVLLGALLLGPLYGAIAGGLGPALADLLTGYAIYAPATLIIKAGMAIVVYFVYYSIKKAFNKELLGVIIGSVLAELLMVAGYFLHACLLMGEGMSALLSVPGNLMQGLVGVIAATLLFVLIKKTKLFGLGE